MAAETTEQKPKTQPVKGKPRNTSRPSFKVTLAFIVMLVVEVLLPVILSGGLFWFLFGYYNFWQYDRTLMLVLFGVAVVAVAFILSILLDSGTAIFRNTFRKLGLKLSTNAQIRLIKLGLGGVIIPILLVVSAALVPLSERGTLISYLIENSYSPASTATPPDVVAGLAIQTQNPSTKILSIQVLQGFHSTQALTQLVRIANEDRPALQDGGVSGSLSKAIASYGTDAKAPLLELFRNIDPAHQTQASGMSSDLYERYFSQSFASLEQEITNETPDPSTKDAQLAQLAAIQAQLKETLARMAENQTQTAGDPRLDFVVQTFLAMNLSQDNDLLAFAQSTAADPRYSSRVRGDALLLTAKLGDQKVLDTLYPFLQNSDLFLQGRALQAIVILQQKNNQTGNGQ